ncbi:SOS response-associated peptidase [Marinicauda algicola]|uniref:Abasic site processing protein n=1 Tax=Marinicauda algicola TaxID=2029849 RepID=A0A4S2GZX4_9PROT|nr:SOS response-associated peptidase [Marinicauda algicola]TGY88382.1 SOS response-associated peptidase [Marinicauda algicola]
MCGRYVITYTLDELRQIFGTEDRPNFEPTWNAAPTDALPVVRRGKDAEPHLSLVRWGLVPHWKADGPSYKDPINARAETAAEKPMFRQALSRRRALVPANGFYEWRKEGEAKEPWYITRTDGAPLVFAGLWERWGEGDAALDSFAILTTEANADIRAIHHRCPVLVGPEDFTRWLDPETDPGPLLTPPPDATLAARRVSKKVNNVRNDGPDLIVPEG